MAIRPSKLLLAFIVVLLSFYVIYVAIVWWGYRHYATQQPQNEPTEMVPEPTAMVRGQVFRLEIADTLETQQKGLGQRDSLCLACGMLFVFEHPDRHGFWMKDMHFPLDILWLRDGTIVHIETNVSHFDQEKIYTPAAQADQVLEINAGLAEQQSIAVGDAVIINVR